MIIHHRHDTAECGGQLLSVEDHEFRAVLLRKKAYRFSPHGLQLCDRRTGKAAKLIDLYARFNFVTL